MQPYQMPAHIREATFKAGQKYSCHSPCDQDCVWEFTVIRRSGSFIWIDDGRGNSGKRAIKYHNGRETCLPLGSYSMAPILRA